MSIVGPYINKRWSVRERTTLTSFTWSR